MGNLSGADALVGAGGWVGMAGAVIAALFAALKVAPLLMSKLSAALSNTRAEKDMIERLEARCDKAERRADDADKRTDSANAERNAMVRELGEMRAAMGRLSAQLETANETIGLLRSEIKTLREAINGKTA